MLEKEWWKCAIVYQIYPRSFRDTNADGIGDIRGITEKLDYLKNLGVNVIWICPTYQSPMDDNGYDISDYYNMDPIFGSNKDLFELIQEASDRNIKLILDLVVNHTSDEHEWFQEALKNPESKFRDYYIFREGINDSPPNNWRSIFGGPAWEKVGDSNLYYLHLFSKKQPDLNWENEELRNEITNMVSYWLEKGIGGFRIDAIGYIKKSLVCRNLPPDDVDGLCYPGPWVLNQPGIEKYLIDLRDSNFRKYNCMTVAEANVPYQLLDQFIGNDGFFNMVFDFSYADLDIPDTGEIYIDVPWSVSELKEKIFISQEETQKIGWGALYLENHDQPRSLNKYIPENEINFYSASMLAGLFMMLRGTPFIYQGQEIGMTNCPMETLEEYRDISAFGTYDRALAAGLSETEAMKVLFKRSRDNSRTPFQWDNSENAGFTKAEKSWIKVNPNYQEINADKQIIDENSLFHFYKKLIELRQISRYSKALSFGLFSRYPVEDDHVIAYERKEDQYKVLIICNFQNKKSCLQLEEDFKDILCSNYKDGIQLNKNLMLRSYECLVIGNKECNDSVPS
jgi:glycosidase